MRERVFIYAWLTSLTIMAIGLLIFAYRIQEVVLSHRDALEILIRMLEVGPELQRFPGVIA